MHVLVYCSDVYGTKTNVLSYDYCPTRNLNIHVHVLTDFMSYVIDGVNSVDSYVGHSDN